MSPPCNDFYLIVQRRARNVAVYPIGNLSPYGGRWMVDERVLSAITQIDHGFLYFDCGRMTPWGSESLGNLVNLHKMVTKRDSRVILCNLPSQEEEFFREGHHDFMLSFFDIHQVFPGWGLDFWTPPAWAWNNGAIPKLAQTIREDRAFHIIPILADALEEGGYTNADILNHCRRPGEHGPDCWLIDLLRILK